MSKKLELPEGTKVPNHLVIIPDGNRRWAKERGLPALEGHRRGFDATVTIARAARDFGVHTLTIWAFSTENWKRSKEEVDYLMKIYDEFIGKHLAEAKKEGARIVHLGRKDRIPKNLADKIVRAEEETRENKNYVFNVALDYGGRDEIVRATKKILEKGLLPEEVTEEVFAEYLDTAGQPYPDPDLLIRTSGEQRTSGILPWQNVYVEFYFEKGHLPDFTAEKLREAIIDYSSRERRFGGNSPAQK